MERLSQRWMGKNKIIIKDLMLEIITEASSLFGVRRWGAGAFSGQKWQE